MAKTRAARRRLLNSNLIGSSSFSRTVARARIPDTSLGHDVFNDRLSDCFADQIVTHPRKMKAIMEQDPEFWKVCKQACAINKNHILLF